MTAVQPIRTLISLRWADMDSYGHVNNVTFLRILEEARVRVFGASNLDDASRSAGKYEFGPSPEGAFALVAKHHIDYVRQLKYRSAPIAVDIWVTSIGGASFDLGYVVQEPNGEIVYVNAETTLVFVSQETGRPLRIPQEYRASLERFLGDPVPLKGSR